MTRQAYIPFENFISEGQEHYASGIMDNKGRDCGTTVIYGVGLADDGNTYLTAYAHANRDGQEFCRNSGRYQTFEIRGENGEDAASQARSRWVADAVQTAKERAADKWKHFN